MGSSRWYTRRPVAAELLLSASLLVLSLTPNSLPVPRSPFPSLLAAQTVPPKKLAASLLRLFGPGATVDTLTIDGSTATAAEFTVNMASMTSDSDRRDGQFRTRIMTVDQYPTSTFVLTSPIDFGTVPAEGVTITATATGDLTLRGVTNPVTFEVQARLENGRIGVFGNIPILFSDYDIPDPTNQIATVKDNGLLEFVLVFERA